MAVVLVWAGCGGSREATKQTEPAPPPGQWITLYDGTSLEGWKQAGPGHFGQQPDGSILGRGGMGLLYYDRMPFRDFVLEAEWKADSANANSGIFVRFPERTDDPWYAVNNGYEIQIDDAQQNPTYRTGSIYNFQAPLARAAKPPGEWNTYRIEVRGQHYQVFLNGVKVNEFIGSRGREGFIGLQNHDDDSRVYFRNIRVMPLEEGGPESLAGLFRSDAQAGPLRVLVVTATHGFRHGPAIDASKRILDEVEDENEFEFDFTENSDDLNAQNLAQYDALFFASSTLRAIADEEVAGEGGGWNVTVDAPEGPRNYWVEIYGVGNAFAIPKGGERIDLTDASVSGSDVRFTITEERGPTTVVATLNGDELAGTATVFGQQLPVTGTRAFVRGTASELGEVLVTEEQRQAILDFLRAGKGVAVAHAGLDAFYDWPAYREMVGGGLFEEHPWTQPVTINVEQQSAATAHWGESFEIRDEIYVLDQNPRWNSRVLLSLDMPSVGIVQGPADITRNDYPISWVRHHNGGRVFVTKLGHFPEVWSRPDFIRHILQGLRIVTGREQADLGGYRVKETIAENVWPDDIAVDERGNVWIAELQGKVHRYDASTGRTRQIALIETTDPVNIEHGLYGIEVDPDFYDGQPWVYLFYAEPETFINTLVRVQYRNGRLDMGTREVILRVPTEPQCCHQAGDLEWGPGKTIMISTGDTGMSEVRPTWENTEAEIQAFMRRNDLDDYHWSRLVDSERSAQNLQDLRGKILRINRDGTIPRDNPFFGQAGVRWEIFAYGLRNPYRFKYDEQTGRMYIGVVGPDEVVTYDWYNIGTGGENFGWPRANGRLLYNEWTPEMIPGFSPSMWEYTYETGGRSASFGPIYRGEGEHALPALFQDKAFIYDWARRWIKWADIEERAWVADSAASVKENPDTIRIPALRLTNIKTFDVLTDTAPISMELGPDGSLYVAEFTGFWGPAPGAKVTRYRWVDGPHPTSALGASAATTENGTTSGN